MKVRVLFCTRSAVCVTLLLAAVAPVAGQTPSSRASAERARAQLPPVAKSRISATIGRDEAIYHAQPFGNGYRIHNRPLGGSAEFTRGGVRLSGGPAGLALTVEAYGNGESLRQLARVAPCVVEGNRIEYRRGEITDWYVNGPSGLEQGFTITKPPASGRGPLTIAIRFAGATRGTIDSNGAAATLRGSSGGAALRYEELSAYDASRRELRSWLELRGSRLLVRVDTTGARYPILIDPYFRVASLTASQPAGLSAFGLSVSMSADGSTVAIESIANTAAAPPTVGSAYVFVKPATGWFDATETARLTPSDGGSGSRDSGGLMISADGSTVAARGNGHVNVFVKPSGGWVNAAESATLAASTGDDLETVAVSADGSTIAAGASQTFPLPAGNGAVYVFTRPSNGWASGTEAAVLTASDGASADALGAALAVTADGSTIVAGAWGKSGAQGAVYVFTTQGDLGWVSEHETAELTALNAAVHNLLGLSVGVSADGSTIVAGAPGTGFESSGAEGAVYVFERPSTFWTTETESAFLAASDAVADANLGISVGISANGSLIASGSPGHLPGDPSGNGVGAVYVFVKPSSGWTTASETLKLIDASADSEDFGWSVAVDGNGSTIVGGEPFKGLGTLPFVGAAYVFQNTPIVFGNFTIGGLQFTQATGGTNFSLNSSFTLGALSAGINPITQPVRLQVGSFFVTIPPGSFHQNKQGNYVFQGTINGVSLDTQIKLVGANSYQFLFEAANAQVQSTASPVAIVLSIGDNGGTSVK